LDRFLLALILKIVFAATEQDWQALRGDPFSKV
jgi:hypothetical protein